MKTNPKEWRNIFFVYESCGENVTWRQEGNTLYVEGSGKIVDSPWREYSKHIEHVVIGKGISQIGEGTFHHYTRLTSITIPDSVTQIGEGAFEDVPHITYHGPAQSDNNWGARKRN